MSRPVLISSRGKQMPYRWLTSSGRMVLCLIAGSVIKWAKVVQDSKKESPAGMVCDRGLLGRRGGLCQSRVSREAINFGGGEEGEDLMLRGGSFQLSGRRKPARFRHDAAP